MMLAQRWPESTGGTSGPKRGFVSCGKPSAIGPGLDGEFLNIPEAEAGASRSELHTGQSAAADQSPHCPFACTKDLGRFTDCHVTDDSARLSAGV